MRSRAFPPLLLLCFCGCAGEMDARSSVAAHSLPELTRAVERDPANVELRTALAGQYQLRDELDLALQHIDAAIEHGAPLHAQAVRILILRGDLQDAHGRLAALAKRPTELVRQVADALHAKRLNDEALANYRWLQAKGLDVDQPMLALRVDAFVAAVERDAHIPLEAALEERSNTREDPTADDPVVRLPELDSLTSMGTELEPHVDQLDAHQRVAFDDARDTLSRYGHFRQGHVLRRHRTPGSCIGFPQWWDPVRDVSVPF